VTSSSAATQPVLQATAIVTWTSPSRGPQRYVVQTTLTSDIGCASSTTRPFAGPCQAFWRSASDR
jgi:hypothetical protein